MTKSNKFFGVIFEPQSYRNILYLLFSFPLGIIYFVFLVTGLSLGFSLLIIWIGIPILLFVIYVWWNFMIFEKFLAENLLNVKIENIKHVSMCQGHWDKLKAHLSNSTTWKGLLYLIIKFPLGIISFVVVVTLLAISLSFLMSTFALHHATKYANLSFLLDMTTWGASLVVLSIGLLTLIISFHIFNGTAYLSGLLIQKTFTKCDCNLCQRAKRIKQVKVKKLKNKKSPTNKKI